MLTALFTVITSRILYLLQLEHVCVWAAVVPSCCVVGRLPVGKSILKKCMGTHAKVAIIITLIWGTLATTDTLSSIVRAFFNRACTQIGWLTVCTSLCGSLLEGRLVAETSVLATESSTRLVTESPLGLVTGLAGLLFGSWNSVLRFLKLLNIAIYLLNGDSTVVFGIEDFENWLVLECVNDEFNLGLLVFRVLIEHIIEVSTFIRGFPCCLILLLCHVCL